MKTSTSKYVILFGTVGFAIACSTKKDSFVNRNFHAVNTEYNVLYNGNIALNAGLTELSATYQDNFWDVLPVERTQPVLPAKEEPVAAAGAPSASTLPSSPSKAGGKPDTKGGFQKDGGKLGGGESPGGINALKGGKGNAGAAGGQVAANAQSGPQGQTANFKRAEEKATKAIQKHSMNIGGTERNPQIDEAHMLLGKSRYYENRFLPAMEAFNYILLKYPSSDGIDDAKIWREKTNIRLDNEGVAVKNLKELIETKKNTMDQQTFADANAILAEGYLKMQANDSAITVLKSAAQFTKNNDQKARYHFILGQLYAKEKNADSSYVEYQRVIDMKRKSPRRYVIQAHAMQAGQFDHTKGDTLAFMEKYRKLLKDRENRPYLDIINHQVALFYDKQKDPVRAKEYYNKSLRQNSADRYLMASNHRNIAEINFKEAKYVSAGMYYDSTMVFLDNRSREYRSIKKKRDNLADVIKYEAIAQANDSILTVVAMDEAGRKAYYEDHIAKIKEKEEIERKRLEAEAIRQENLASASGGSGNMMLNAPAFDTGLKQRPGISSAAPSSSGSSVPGYNPGGAGGKFYFYTASTVSYGKQEFKRKWGSRTLSDNWRWSAEQSKKGNTGTDDAVADGQDAAKSGKDKPVEARFTIEFYTSQLPTSQVVIDSLAKDRNFAYYQLGSIYKEKFKEYRLAADKLEALLKSNPEERLVLPSKYNLYKIYQIIDPAKAETYKNQILSQYPDSRYAEIIKNPASDAARNLSPDVAYAELFKRYNQGQVREVYAAVDDYIDNYTGEEIVSKFELLKVKATARLTGLEEYAKGLNYVALNYPNSSEGKEADRILKTDIPTLEALAFGRPSVSWKIVFKFDSADDPKIKPLTEKIEKFIKEGLNNTITLSNDIYTLTENMLVVHGFISKLAAEDAVSVLKDYKKYKVAEVPVIMSAEDYKVVQIKKNFNQFSPVE
ncbi:gliding motility protein [Flavobacterium sp. DG1-102-2]|uniref:type IX secretion system periplasmic lipoprotein PorW/SprE n=1 Tax=Flavobacterium sp. DG1-102-2 TaxID=3081663 RepID=UPI002948D7DD|nr:gliding motility protein [Flavobacterium sp. DG1-102-2]MDV6167710.1 gliding motility protein [Flavobacterium sp. DG1-102-2]